MKITSDAISQFISLRDTISAEREQLHSRLREIDAALGAMDIRGATSYYGLRQGQARAHNELSLKEAVLKVIEGKALTREAVLNGVLAFGYTFSTNDPMNSLGVVLYGKNPKFKNDRGRVSR